MYRRVKSNRSNNEYNNCNSQGDQLIVLAAIISSIIYQEIQDDDELNTVGNLFVAIGSNILLGVGQRSVCTSDLNKNNTTENQDDQNLPTLPNTNVPLRSKGNNKMKKGKKVKKVKKRHKKI
ncbi:hypothetical protein [Terrisporobacter mayombei]|uniref:Uncharacterized protein n=1 Tax=Terrisporobacter mayombei TaxID=1541 RepID=A0ABY9PZB2_9FIRM|nr:hypothetical protein [Terrisporobacter mayombei]MCC3866796.1 hypothetical protein [Terrisporobacter mayombei]WMT81036.1 hypothetical protein TEMA_13680 [Terrisporobacter mayombei]